MRGRPDWNRAEFEEKAEMLRSAGYDVFNPLDADREFQDVVHRPPTIRECMRQDTAWICDVADGLALLAGWEHSYGARAEVALAQAIGIPHNFVIYWLQRAKNLEAA